MEKKVFFQFEAEFVESLRCIPMQVRLKLDTCGVKLKLSHWHQFSQEERKTAVELPCNRPAEVEAYGKFIQQLVTARTGKPASVLPIDPRPAWMDTTVIPASLQEKAREFDFYITLEQWAALIPLQRFALIKLSRASHENKNFLPAIEEFNIV